MKYQRVSIPNPMIKKKRQIRIKSLAVYRTIWSWERNKKPWFARLVSCRVELTTLTKGPVKKLIRELTTAIVIAIGSKMIRPVRKYFFTHSLYLNFRGRCKGNYCTRDLVAQLRSK